MKTQFQISPLATLFSILTCSLVIYFLLFFRRPVEDKTRRLGCLDGLRGFLAMGVFFRHYVVCYYSHLNGKWDTCPSIFYYLIAKVGVALFFTITGFLFWYKIWTGQGKVNWFNLYISRIFRIIPLYWFATIVIIFIVFVIGGATIKEPLINLLSEILRWLSFLWIPDINKFYDTGRILAYVQWTLKYEWLFYTSLPLLALGIRFSKGRSLIPWLMAAIVILGTVKPFDIPIIGINTKFFIYFLIGAVAASNYNNVRLRNLAQQKIFSLIAVLSMVLFFIIYKIDDQPSQYLLLAVFFIPIALGNSLFGLLKMPIFILLGEISYSIYLLHGIVLYLVFTIFIPSFFTLQTSQFGVYLGMALTGIIVVCVSLLTYSLLEKPFMDLGKSIVKNRGKTYVRTI